ncbi:putative dehydrogenase [Arthrobacter pigmenti]|uniref:Putative dehydrogenase n=1 Tax=Arthrobacter pigmenti TaxID=271432 RepID=A0A846RT36_9MICC|nr:putative dehydrogenase [Arthrobacter pigmenti]
MDLNLSAAQAAVEEFGLRDVASGTSVSEVAAASGTRAVVNVTVSAAHHPVNVEAMFVGLPVLCEKPVAPTVAEGLSLAAAAEVSGQLLMISQSRRYFQGLTQLKALTAELGDIGVVTTEFFKAPHVGGFREEMAHVLLVDMAIHQFDAVWFLLDQDPVSVYCDEFNPSWSWYDGAAAATAVFQMSGGTRYVYTGSWCADGLETPWNGSWRMNGAGASAAWEPVAELLSGAASVSAVSHQPSCGWPGPSTTMLAIRPWIPVMFTLDPHRVGGLQRAWTARARSES